MAFPFVVFAEETVDEPRITFVKKGQPAPYSGALLNSTAQAQVMAEKDNVKAQCELSNEYLRMRERAACDLKVGTAKVDLNALQEKYAAVTKIKDAEIDRLVTIAGKNNNNYVWWAAAGGLVVGILLTVGTAALVNHTTK
jgi:hypothetical protein